MLNTKTKTLVFTTKPDAFPPKFLRSNSFFVIHTFFLAFVVFNIRLLLGLHNFQ